MINTILGLAPGGTTGPANPEYYRALGTGSVTDTSVTGTGAVVTPVGGLVFKDAQTVTIALPSAFKFLVATYDGPNGGSEIWYLGGVAGGTELLLPKFAKPNPATSGLAQHLIADTGQYGISDWTLVGPTTTVPDGGTTAILLGLAMASLGLLSGRKV